MGFEIRTDEKKNRLYIVLGDLEKTEVREIVRQLTAKVANLVPPFSCVVDIREMHIRFSETEKMTIEIIQGALSDAGMGKVVRVVGKSNKLAHMKMDEISRSVGYKGKPVNSIEEADIFLDELEAAT